MAAVHAVGLLRRLFPGSFSNRFAQIDSNMEH